MNHSTHIITALLLAACGSPDADQLYRNPLWANEAAGSAGLPQEAPADAGPGLPPEAGGSGQGGAPGATGGASSMGGSAAAAGGALEASGGSDQGSGGSSAEAGAGGEQGGSAGQSAIQLALARTCLGALDACTGYQASDRVQCGNGPLVYNCVTVFVGCVPVYGRPNCYSGCTEPRNMPKGCANNAISGGICCSP